MSICYLWNTILSNGVVKILRALNVKSTWKSGSHPKTHLLCFWESSSIIRAKNRSKQKGTISSSHTNSTHPQHSYCIFIHFFLPSNYTGFSQRPTSSKIYSLDFLPFYILKDIILIINPFSSISSFFPCLLGHSNKCVLVFPYYKINQNSHHRQVTLCLCGLASPYPKMITVHTPYYCHED